MYLEEMMRHKKTYTWFIVSLILLIVCVAFPYGASRADGAARMFMSAFALLFALICACIHLSRVQRAKLQDRVMDLLKLTGVARHEEVSSFVTSNDDRVSVTRTGLNYWVEIIPRSSSAEVAFFIGSSLTRVYERRLHEVPVPSMTGKPTGQSMQLYDMSDRSVDENRQIRRLIRALEHHLWTRP